MIKTLSGVLLLALLLIVGIWFFFLKEYDYTLSFKTDEVPGEVYQKLLAYDYQNVTKTGEIERVPFNKLIHSALFEEDTLQVTWVLEQIKDSVTTVKAGINHPNQPFWDRLKYLSGSGGSKKELLAELLYLKTTLELDSVDYKVEIKGMAKSPETTCACFNLESEVTRKAEMMIKTINHLSEFILQNDLETTGRPRVIINHWDLETNLINYDFCFPIAENSTFRAVPEIEIKKLPAVKSLKAIYNGNYRNSHFAWTRLLHYAEKNNIEVENSPQEVFNNNPEMGGNSINWEAEIYLPVK